jgi:hypothetical protein
VEVGQGVRSHQGKAVNKRCEKVPELSHFFFFFELAKENYLSNNFHSATMAPTQDPKLNALVYKYLSSQEFTEAAKALKKKIGSVSLPTKVAITSAYL